MEREEIRGDGGKNDSITELVFHKLNIHFIFETHLCGFQFFFNFIFKLYKIQFFVLCNNKHSCNYVLVNIG